MSITQREVLSRAKAEKQKFNEDTLVISIYWSEDEKPKLKWKARVVSMMFDDVDDHEEWNDKYTHMSDRHAVTLARHIRDCWAKKLVVHCHAGICRSSAIMQSFLEWEFWENSPVIEARFKTWRFVPNTWVRDKMRKAFSKLPKRND